MPESLIWTRPPDRFNTVYAFAPPCGKHEYAKVRMCLGGTVVCEIFPGGFSHRFDTLEAAKEYVEAEFVAELLRTDKIL